MENMMESNLDITAVDTEYIKSAIKEKFYPVEFADIAYQLALFKTQDIRKRQVKLYHPNCEYFVGDLIFKYYPGKLPVGSKKFIDIAEGVILKVEEVRDHFDHIEIRLTYDGTSDFRKYIEFLKRQKIDLLLPHKQSTPPRGIEYLPEETDPRSQQAPLVEKEFSQLKKKLAIALHKDNNIVFLSNKLMLKINLKEIKPEVFENLKQFLRTHLQSEKTEFFVQNFIHIEPETPDFESYCFSLNYNLFQNQKIDLQQTDSHGWGKWHLISILYQLKKNALVNEINPLLISIPLDNRKYSQQKKKWLEDAVFSEGDNRYYLTQREISSGAVRLRSPLTSESNSIEIEITDSSSRKTYTLYYYHNEHLLLGLDKIFESYHAIQGMILVLDYDENRKLSFTIKTTKKGIISEKIVYNTDKNIFQVTEEKIASSVLVNKQLFLEADVFQSIEAHIEEYRRLESYNKLIHKIFLEFGLRERNFEIHIFRLYHILDLIFPIEWRMLSEIIFSNPEFIPSEKVAGVFYLDSDAVVEIEEEEKNRRQFQIEESKRKREEFRHQQQEEELKKKEEIRHLREERKKKREEEMRFVESMQKEKHNQSEKKIFSTTEEQANIKFIPSETIAQSKRQQMPILLDDQSISTIAKSDGVKKSKKKLEIDKPQKTAKKGQKKILEEKIELSEIKKEILAEEITVETIEKQKEKIKKAKETEVAYHDQGIESGLFAQLDELVIKEKKELKEKTKKGKK